MLMQEIIRSLLTAVLFFAVMITLTLVIETPIIVRSGITDNRAYIRGVNIVTNAALHLILAGIVYLETVRQAGIFSTLRIVWFIFAEALLIPLAEALAYRKISGAGTKRIFAFTYLANLASCAAGLILETVIRAVGLVN